VRVSEDTYRRTKRLAQEREATVSALARLALVRYLDEEQEQRR
jgi:predicted transcriptional regulator